MMTPETFRALQHIADAEAGIFLRPGKEALVQARLAPRLRELGLDDACAYLDVLRGDRGELVRFLDVITTNFTKFFREADHFDLLREWASAARAAGQTRFRFWCAGCATGEEPWSAAMVLAPVLGATDWKILATDISTRALARAEAGVYFEEEVAPVPAALRARYLAPTERDGRRAWRIPAALRAKVVFERLNLADRPFALQGPLDAVFCRNVMIYFDRGMRVGVVEEIERLLRPGAPLFIGHSESLNGVATRLRAERPSVYRRLP